jgi:hypothetical protein
MSKRKPVRAVKTMFRPECDSIPLLRGDVNSLYEYVAMLAGELRKIGMRLDPPSHPMVDDSGGDLDDDDDDDSEG